MITPTESVAVSALARRPGLRCFPLSCCPIPQVGQESGRARPRAMALEFFYLVAYRDLVARADYEAH